MNQMTMLTVIAACRDFDEELALSRLRLKSLGSPTSSGVGVGTLALERACAS